VVSVTGNSTVLWIPYARYVTPSGAAGDEAALGPKAIVVFANTGHTDASVVVRVNVTQLGLKEGPASMWNVQNLWTVNGPVEKMNEQQLARLSTVVPGDLKPRGGLAVLKITPVM
jgi:hypothetical protein